MPLWHRHDARHQHGKGNLPRSKAGGLADSPWLTHKRKPTNDKAKGQNKNKSTYQFLLPLNQALEQIVPIRIHLQPLLQHQINALHTLPEYLRARHLPDNLNKPVQSDVAQRPHRRHALQAAQDELQPRMLAISLQRTKRHTKDQVTRDVESRAVIPVRRIQGHPPFLALLMKLVNQQIDILANQRPLTAHGRVREAVGQTPAELGV